MDDVSLVLMNHLDRDGDLAVIAEAIQQVHDIRRVDEMSRTGVFACLIAALGKAEASGVLPAEVIDAILDERDRLYELLEECAP